MGLIVPNQYGIYKVMGIDPGLNNTGIAVFDMDYNTRNIIAIEAATLINSKLTDRTGLDGEFHTERTIKLHKLKAGLKDTILRINPAVVACESPFYNRLCPMAYGALLEVLSVIHSAVIEHDCNIVFKTIEPLLVKKIVGAGMTKGKVDVKDSISRNNQIMSVLKQDINTLDEHSIDAIGVAFSFLTIYNPNHL